MLTGYDSDEPHWESSREERPLTSIEEPEDLEENTHVPDENTAVIESNPEESDDLIVEVEEDLPVDLTADSLSHDDEAQTITASGNVELIQGERHLRADRVVYNLTTDTVSAHGSVVLSEPNGDIHYFDDVELSENMSRGFVKGMESYLVEGGIFTAEQGQKEDGIITMQNASYTPCNCEDDEDFATDKPGWQIKAEEVKYDKEKHKISYKNAQFEVLGVPLLWTPYLSHSDGQEERKSGLLTPQFGFDSDLGAVVTQNYYWDLAPNRDLTAGVMLTTSEIPVALAQYRHRFSNAEIIVDASGTYSDRTDRVNGADVKKDQDWRGHLFAEGLWDINEKWRAGVGLELTSDDQYLRQYNFSSEDVLENEIYVERFSGRNYAVGRLLSFQDVRIDENRTDQPDVLPEIIVSAVGDPNAMLGGRWGLDLSFLDLERSGDDQDMTRVVGQAEWEKRLVTDFGLVNTVVASIRGDAFFTRDREVAGPGSNRSGEGTETRVFPRVHAVTSYPFVKPYENMQAVIEPVAALTLSPNIDVDSSDIPNEDSQDVQIDASNLFEPNRFPGLDRIEDQSRATYGLRTGVYGYDGSYANLFIGQSHRFDNDDNPFPEGSGLSRQESDVVGQIAGNYRNRYGMNYRFQLNSDDLSSQRHELDAFAKWDRLSLNTRYLFAESLEGTDITESREQLENHLSYYANENWRLRTGALYDFGEDPGLRKAVFGVDYFGCCIFFSATAERNLTTDASGDSGTDVTFRLGLKGLGEFQQSEAGAVSGTAGQ